VSEETEIFEDSFRVTIKVADFREMIHAIEYTSTNKEYIKRFPTHAMKQDIIIPVMQSLLNRVQKAIDTKKIEFEKRHNEEVRHPSGVCYETDGVTMKKENIHNNGQD
jgi:hypothetical protein